MLGVEPKTLTVLGSAVPLALHARLRAFILLFSVDTPRCALRIFVVSGGVIWNICRWFPLRGWYWNSEEKLPRLLGHQCTQTASLRGNLFILIYRQVSGVPFLKQPYSFTPLELIRFLPKDKIQGCHLVVTSAPW